MAGRILGAHVEIPAFLQDVDERLQRAETLMLEEVAREGAKELAKRAPGGAAGSIGKHAHGLLVGPTESLSVIVHPGAKAQDRGAFIQAKNKKRLKFVTKDGNTVFVRSVRIPATHFVKKAERARGRIVKAAFARSLERELHRR